MIDFDEYGLKPAEFATFARMSVYKMRKDPETALVRVDAIVQELQDMGLSLREWAHEDLVPGITPLALWKKASSTPILASLFEDPSAEVRRVFPTLQTTQDVEEQIRALKGAHNQGG